MSSCSRDVPAAVGVILFDAGPGLSFGEVVPGERRTVMSRAIDVPEADAIEQAIEEPVDLDDEPPETAESDHL